MYLIMLAIILTMNIFVVVFWQYFKTISDVIVKLPWQWVLSTEGTSIFPLLQIVSKTKKVTYGFVGKPPKFLKSSGKSNKISVIQYIWLYLYKKRVFLIQKIVLDNFPPSIFIWSGLLIVVCMQKIKIGDHLKFWEENKMCFLRMLFPDCLIYKYTVYFWCTAHATFYGKFDSFSSHVHLCFGMAGYAPSMQLKTLSRPGFEPRNQVKCFMCFLNSTALVACMCINALSCSRK